MDKHVLFNYLKYLNLKVGLVTSGVRQLVDAQLPDLKGIDITIITSDDIDMKLGKIDAVRYILNNGVLSIPHGIGPFTNKDLIILISNDAKDLFSILRATQLEFYIYGILTGNISTKELKSIAIATLLSYQDLKKRVSVCSLQDHAVSLYKLLSKNMFI